MLIKTHQLNTINDNICEVLPKIPSHSQETKIKGKKEKTTKKPLRFCQFALMRVLLLIKLGFLHELNWEYWPLRSMNLKLYMQILTEQVQISDRALHEGLFTLVP